MLVALVPVGVVGPGRGYRQHHLFTRQVFAAGPIREAMPHFDD